MGRFFRSIVFTTIGLALVAALTVIVKAVFRAIFTVEIEEYWNGVAQPYLEEKGWAWLAAMIEYATSFWGGIALALIALMFVDRLHARFRSTVPDEPSQHSLSPVVVAPNIPTHIRFQFKAGSSQVVQLENSNIRNAHCQRFEFNFLSDTGEPIIPSRIIWNVVLVFQQPTQYGQIIVDAGEAELPAYRISLHNYLT